MCQMEGDCPVVENSYKDIYYFKSGQLCSFKTCYKLKEKPFLFNCLAPLKIGWFIPSSSDRNSVCNKDHPTHPHACTHICTCACTHTHAWVHADTTHQKSGAHTDIDTNLKIHMVSHTCTLSPTHSHVHICKQSKGIVSAAHLPGGFL